MSKTHLIADEKLGGIKREYVEVERKAGIGDLIVFKEDDLDITEGKPYKVERLSTGDVVFLDDENDEHHWSNEGDEEFSTLEPTDIVHVEGQRYRLVERKASVGEKVLVVNPVVTAGRYKKGDVLTVVEYQQESSDYDEGIRVNFDGFNGFFLYSTEFRVVEPVAEGWVEKAARKHRHVMESLKEAEGAPELTESDVRNNPRQVIDLIGNLALRLTELERQTEDNLEALEEHALRISGLADANEQAVTTVARNVETWAQEVEAVKKRLADEKETVTISKSLFDKLSAAERREL
jgi:hypothetical protein